MSKHDLLLNEVRTFCDSQTGEVLKRIPEELMQKLRLAKLAKGIPHKASKRTDSYATWFVFFNSDIRDDVMNEWREAQRALNRKRHTRPPNAKTPSEPTKPHSSNNQGLKQFVKRRTSDK